MKHYFVRFHAVFPVTLDFPAWEAERGMALTSEHAIEYGSDITNIEQTIAAQLFHQRGIGDHSYYLKQPPQPTVCVIDWRELLGDHRPGAAPHVDG